MCCISVRCAQIVETGLDRGKPDPPQGIGVLRIPCPHEKIHLEKSVQRIPKLCNVNAASIPLPEI